MKILRKVVSIVFLVLLLFNILGYYGLFIGLQYQNDLQMTQNLDNNNYDKSETIAIDIPITIPYAQDHEGFQRINGTFEHKGEFYQLVEQRLSNDTLHVICVMDHQGKRINQALVSFVKSFTDKPVNDNQSALTFSDFIKDYITTSFSISHLSFGWHREVGQSSSLPVFIPSFYASIIHPPERLGL